MNRPARPELDHESRASTARPEHHQSREATGITTHDPISRRMSAVIASSKLS
jgi:hypothetical protein